MNDLSMHVLDIVQNSISAGAKLIQILVNENISDDLLEITIIDNGKGMSKEQVERLPDPFFTSRTTRKVGMGIPLLKQTALQSGGSIEIDSEVGVGTRVYTSFKHSNIDRPPLGDIANAVMLLVSSNVDIDFLYEYSFNNQVYDFDTKEIREELDGLPLNSPSIIRYLEEMIKENMSELSENR